MKSNSVRRYAAVLGLVSLAACSVNLAFDIAKDAEVVSTQGSVATAIPVDLSESKEVQEHKGNIEALSLDSVDLTVTAVESDNSATSVTGSLALRAADAPADGSQDVVVGAIDALPISVGAKVHIPGNPDLDKFLFDQLQGAGEFSAVVAGTTKGGPTHATIHVAMHASLAYGIGL
ncbi:MAG: hypothetical protein ACJ78W_00545 [Myxococcales bacterium]